MEKAEACGGACGRWGGGKGGSNCAVEPFIESRLQLGSMVLKHRAFRVPDTHPSREREMEREVDKWDVERKHTVVRRIGYRNMDAQAETE